MDWRDECRCGWRFVCLLDHLPYNGAYNCDRLGVYIVLYQTSPPAVLEFPISLLLSITWLILEYCSVQWQSHYGTAAAQARISYWICTIPPTFPEKAVY